MTSRISPSSPEGPWARFKVWINSNSSIVHSYFHALSYSLGGGWAPSPQQARFLSHSRAAWSATNSRVSASMSSKSARLPTLAGACR